MYRANLHPRHVTFSCANPILVPVRYKLSMLVAAVLVLGVATLAYAHATLVSAVPAAGSHLENSPLQLRLVFSEALEIPMAQVALVSSTGKRVRLTTKGDPHDVNALIALVPPLAPGSYRVEWRVVSDDGHPVSGTYEFGVGVGAGVAVGSPSATETARPATVDPGWGPQFLGAPISPAMLRGTALFALLAFVGMLGFMAVPASIAEQLARPRESVARWLGAAAIALFGCSTLAWILNVTPDHSLAWESAKTALKTTEGTAQWNRVLMTFLATSMLRNMGRVRGALFFGVAAILISGASGHSAAISPFLATPAKSIHLLASAAWLGGLIWFIAGGPRDANTMSSEVRRLSSVALAAVILVFLSGAAQTLLFLPSLADLFHTAYGAVILAKVAGFGVLVLFGAKHRYRMMPRLTSDAAMPGLLAVSLRREIFTMGVVVLIGGFLAFVPTPARPAVPSSPLALTR